MESKHPFEDWLIAPSVFNRETREDGGMPPYERSYLNETFMHTGLGIGIIAVAARSLHMSGWSYRLMAANPWLVLGVGLAGSIGSMYGCFATAPKSMFLPLSLYTQTSPLTTPPSATFRNTPSGPPSASPKPPFSPR